MVALTETQMRFLERYLGVRIDDPPRDGSDRDLLPIWQSAKDAVDDQLRRLSDTLRKSGSPEVAAVADDVKTLLQPVRATVPATLMDFDRSTDRMRSPDTVLSAIDRAEAWLTSDSRISAVDANPWGVPVSVATTMSAAFQRIRNNLSRA